MANYYTQTNGANDWRKLLLDPKKQWKSGYSAYELAHCWEDAINLPVCVEDVLSKSQIPIFEKIDILFGFPEYKVSLPGGNTSSQNDLYVLAKSQETDELITIMVEGKVSEPFGETVAVWKGQNPSVGKKQRIAYLLEQLDLNESNILNKRYQLLHRTASSLIEARKVNAKNALMLVHSFSETGKWFDDYREFVELFNLNASKDAVVGPVILNGVKLYFGWVSGKKVELSESNYLIEKKTDSEI
jgi:hypothetical protein